MSPMPRLSPTFITGYRDAKWFSRVAVERKSQMRYN